MTDTLPDVYSAGQRRAPGGTFPVRPGSGGGPSDTPGRTIHQAGDDPEPSPGTDPCANPDSALEWNTDAAAAEALRRMQADADDPLLDGRERSFVIYRDPATGWIRLGNIAVGPNMGGEVTPDITGINFEDIIGVIHSHPASGPYPSGPDRTNFVDFWQPQIAQAGGDPSLFRIYIVGTRADSGDPARLQIRVYNQDNLHGDEESPGPEVNPNADFCPN